MTTTEAIANAVVILFAPLEGCQLLKFTCSSKSLIPTPFWASAFLRGLRGEVHRADGVHQFDHLGRQAAGIGAQRARIADKIAAVGDGKAIALALFQCFYVGIQHEFIGIRREAEGAQACTIAAVVARAVQMDDLFLQTVDEIICAVRADINAGRTAPAGERRCLSGGNFARLAAEMVVGRAALCQLADTRRVNAVKIRFDVCALFHQLAQVLIAVRLEQDSGDGNRINTGRIDFVDVVDVCAAGI